MKTHNLGLGRSKLKAAQLFNHFPGFLGKNVKNCPPSKLLLFTSLPSSEEYQARESGGAWWVQFDKIWKGFREP